MTAMHRYRAVSVEVICQDHERPLVWESHTTMTDAELDRRAKGWAVGVWGCDLTEADHGHTVTITEVPEVSTGSRRD